MPDLSELLIFLIIAAISMVGKFLENSRKTPSPPARRVSEDREETSTTEENTEEGNQGLDRPEVAQAPPPPVAEIPAPVRRLLDKIQALTEPAPPPPPPPETRKVPERPMRIAPAAELEPVTPSSGLAATLPDPRQLRTGIIWQVILDKPRCQRPWRRI